VTHAIAALMHGTVKSFITFVQKCFALAVAAISAELRAILPNKIYKYYFCATLLILRTLANSVCAEF